MEFKGQHILSTKQFNKEDLLAVFEEARKMEEVLARGGSDLMKGKLMATLFFEPSTRTRFSFEAAMHRLGGCVISNPDMMTTSSLKKLESLIDTGKTVSRMADIIIMRHPEAGTVHELATSSIVPVINAGDGPAEHPTQALLDLYTIWKEKGRLDGLTIGMIGDLKNGRVPHSQCRLLKHFDVKFIFVSPGALKMPDEIVQELKENSREMRMTENIEDAILEMDVIGMTRVQKERFSTEEEYQKYAGIFVLNGELMKKAKRDSIVIHPLPRVDEIAAEVDSDPRAKYFEQVHNGVVVRMALLAKVLG